MISSARFFAIHLYRGLRLLRGLAPGYHLSPLRGFKMDENSFFRAKKLRSVESFPLSQSDDGN